MINVEGGIDDAEMHFCAIINEPIRSIGVVLIGGSRILREDLLKSGLVAGAEQTKFSIRCLPTTSRRWLNGACAKPSTASVWASE